MHPHSGILLSNKKQALIHIISDDFKGIMLRGENQSQKVKYCMFYLYESQSNKLMVIEDRSLAARVGGRV